MNIKNLPYRRGVIGVITNKEREILIVQMIAYGVNDWRFPGGGIEDGESPENALLRELGEELGTDKFIIKKRSTILNRYEWSNEMVQKQYRKRKRYYRGQEQIQFLVEFTGEKFDIRINSKELRQIKWVKKDEIKRYFNFKGQYEMAMNVFEEFGL
ncbi:MAG: NUDIX domain-containing protein [Patescibacteria group bacterium]|nr:NUDIX domain-containing protein [Patescibacteria group bacterium]